MAGIFADPFTAFRFSVEIDQHEVGGFSEVSGLAFEKEVEIFREGGVNDHDVQLAGPSKYPSRLVLKRGLGDLQYLWAWYLDVAHGMIARREIAIQLYDVEGKRQRSWRFREACPVKWTGPELRANTSAVAFESIEVVHRGLA
jgi:phage tail-like protein